MRRVAFGNGNRELKKGEHEGQHLQEGPAPTDSLGTVVSLLHFALK